MKFKINDFVWFYPKAKKDMTFDDVIKSIGHEWAGEIKTIRIDEDNNVFYSIQTYMLYSPYEFFEKIPEEGCFATRNELRCYYIEQKLEELELLKKKLEEIKNSSMNEEED